MIWDLEKENQSLKDVLDQVQEGDLILLADQTYVEKVAVKTKNITMIGKPNTKICFHASHGTLVPKEEGGDGKKCTEQPAVRRLPSVKKRPVSKPFKSRFKTTL